MPKPMQERGTNPRPNPIEKVGLRLSSDLWQLERTQAEVGSRVAESQADLADQIMTLTEHICNLQSAIEELIEALKKKVKKDA